MTRKLILTVAILFMCCYWSYGQRYIPGQKGFQVSAGFSDGFQLRNTEGQAYYVSAALSSYNKKANRWVFGADYLQRKYAYCEQLLPVSQITGEISHYLQFFSDRSKTVFFSVGASGMLGYEAVNWGSNTLFDGSVITASEGFIYGGSINFEIETFLTDRVVLLVQCRERCLWGTSIGKFHFTAGIGFKFLIN